MIQNSVDLKHKLHMCYTNIDQKLMDSLQGLLNCEIGDLDCHCISTEYGTLCPLYTHVTPAL